MPISLVSSTDNKYKEVWNETRACADKYKISKIFDSLSFDSVNFHTVPDSMMARVCGANGPGCFRKTTRSVYIRKNEPESTLRHEVLHANGYAHGVPPFGVCD